MEMKGSLRSVPRQAHPALGPLVLRSARLPDPATLAPRQWLYGTQLLRGFVSVLVAPGGVGKSSYAMALAMCVAMKTPFLGEHVFEQCNVVVLNLEDPMEELDRRLAALTIRYKVRNEELDGRYFMHSGEDRPITMSALGTDGFEIVHPDQAALIEEIRAHNIGLIVVDPFAESHSLEENNNPMMVKASAAWRRVARATQCAILLIHHVRKGMVVDIESSRGAKALTDSARVGLLLQPMSKEDGEKLDIPEQERHRYVRLDDAKSNMAARADKARWFQLETVPLGNANASYPKGDHVAAIVPWTPQSVWEQTSAMDIGAVVDAIEQGAGGGVLFTATARGGSANSVTSVLCDLLGVNETQAREMAAAWLKSGLLVEVEYTHPKYRRAAKGVRVDNTKRPTI